jgi:ribosome-associated toxin RatA of RatAB toxin-antitoxin module
MRGGYRIDRGGAVGRPFAQPVRQAVGLRHRKFSSPVMQRVKKSVLVPYSSLEMFELVEQVEQYPEFLPWCAGVQVLAQLPSARTVRIDIDYHGLRTHFTTDNANRPGEAIVVTLRDGTFRHLHGEWRFHALAPDACKVEFELAYEFSTLLLERVVGPVFSHIADTFIDAFVQRAQTRYGARP